MKISYSIFNINSFKNLDISKIDELLININSISRFGEIDLSDLKIILEKSCNTKIVLVWDLLMTEEYFLKSLTVIESIDIRVFEAIRITDLGAMSIINELYPNTNIQINLENGNHNLNAVNALQRSISNVTKIILSTEVPISIIKSWMAKVKTPVELLGIGKILLYYSPRKLVSTNNNNYWIKANSDESNHNSLPVMQNRHGTFMFNNKDLCLFDYIEELKEFDISYRIDIYRRFEKINVFLNDYTKFQEEYKKIFNIKLIKGFFKVNKTDSLFKKLKNKHLVKNENFIGIVISVEKGINICVKLKKDLVVNSLIILITPDGKKINYNLKLLKNSLCEIVAHLNKEELAILPFIKGISPKTSIYID